MNVWSMMMIMTVTVFAVWTVGLTYGLALFHEKWTFTAATV